MVIRDVPIIGR